MKNSLNIALITPRLDIGGEELSTISIARELIKRGHNVTYISKDGPLLEKLREENIPFIKASIDGKKPWHFLSGAFSLREVMTKNKFEFDIVHCAEPRPTIMSFIAARISMRRNIKIIWHDRNTKYHFIAGGIFNFLADFVIAISDFERKKLIHYGLSRKKIETIHNCLYLSTSEHVDKDNSERGKLGLCHGDKVVGMVAKMIPEKGHRYFLEAIPSILKYSPQTKFLLVGGGPLERELRELAYKLNIYKSVVFAGYYKNMGKIYTIIDILVLYSWKEAFGNVCIEAGAFGKPVVASNAGGIAEAVVDGKTGILVPPKNPRKLAEAIIYLLENPDIAKKMGEAGRKRVREYFTIERVGNEVEKVYEHLTGNRP